MCVCEMFVCLLSFIIILVLTLLARSNFLLNPHRVSHQAFSKGIELFYEMLPHPLTQRVIGDDMRVRQILLVLLSNAMKFTVGRPNERIIVSGILCVICLFCVCVSFCWGDAFPT